MNAVASELTDLPPTREYPFGRDTKTLILCRDEKRAREAAAALKIPACYRPWTAPLMGTRWEKIIVIVHPETAIEKEVFDRMCGEVFPTKLVHDGQIYYL